MTRAAAAVVTENETFFLINNVPATNAGIVFNSIDPLEDFKAEDEVVNAQGQPVVAILNVAIDRPIPPIGIGDYFYEYEVAITTQLPGSDTLTEVGGIISVSYPSNADFVTGRMFRGYCEGFINDNGNITVESQNALALERGIDRIIVSDLPTGSSNLPVNTTAIVLGTDGMPLSNTTVVAAEETLSGFSGVH